MEEETVVAKTKLVDRAKVFITEHPIAVTVGAFVLGFILG